MTERNLDKVVLAGAAGFIGHVVARQLLDRGTQVLGIDDLNGSTDPALKRWRLDTLLGAEGFEFAQVDIADDRALASALGDFQADAVINLAARAGVRQSVDDPRPYVRTNVLGGVNLLEWCRKRDVRAYMLASTSSLYGIHNERPFRENADTDRPLSPYAATKKAAETMAATYTHLYGLATPICRYFTVYGPAGRPDMSPFRFVRWISREEPLTLYGDGEQERDFTFVSDVARGTILATRLVEGHEIFNIGGDAPVTMSAFIRTLEREIGSQAVIKRHPAHSADMRATWADVRRSEEKLGWRPQVSLEDGVRETVAWYRQNKAFADGVKLDVS